MPPQTMEVPQLQLHQKAEATPHLTLVLERLLWMMKRIAVLPELFVAGQHHQNLRLAIDELEEQILNLGNLPSTNTRTVQQQLNAVVAHANQQELRQHGLLGHQLRMKLDAFEAPFLAFVNGAALVESKYRDLNDRLMALEGRDFHKEVRELKPAAVAALGAGETIATSLGEAIVKSAEGLPGGAVVSSAIKESAGIFRSLIQWGATTKPG